MTDTFNAYNTYDQLPMIPYNIITFLMNNNEDIWKLLKYTGSDALDQPVLTLDEKASLIYNGQDDASVNSDSSLYNVFQSPFTDDSFNDTCRQLRVYPINIIPTNRIIGVVDVGIEILSHVKINQLNNYSTAILTMVQNIIKTLNGRDIEALGNLYFDKKGSFADVSRLNLYNNRSYLGYTLVMSVNCGGEDL